MLPFGTVVAYRGETVQTPVGDHAVPWSLTGETKEWNLVVCCQICNAMKHSKVFTSHEEARRHLLVERMKRSIYTLMIPDASLCEDPERWAALYAEFYSQDALSDLPED